jgi:hypothetical protein
MKRNSTLITIVFCLVGLPTFPQPSKSASESTFDPNSTYQSVPFSPSSSTKQQALDSEMYSAAPPPPVETPITGTEFLLGGGLLLGIKRTYRHFKKRRQS